ncbi:MAG: alpha/beta hydrolase [Acidobacteriaceae bacterium]|nr:alpha/beta hydrolase [Acidobacteriaceae bacterium]MBV9498379.1 alpha/beta hydrolase [Acidobacteriaceae bacterium]
MSAILCAGIVWGQSNEHRTILLWPEGAPGAQGETEADTPSLTLYPASDANKVPTGVVVCPGGGYVHLAMDYEGFEIAEWLNKLGISAFVLRYRLGPKYHYPVQLQDAQRAIRYVRLHAQEFGVQPDRIGIWGFSAGGHLASTVGTHFDAGDKGSRDVIEQQSSRPDFMILAYPVITMMDPYVHRGSLHALLGDDPDPRLVRLLSNELQVTRRTPPTFLFHTANDNVVPVENSIEFDEALNKAGVPAEMHIYLKGRHGVGLAADDPVLRTWPDRLADWLRVQGLR